MWGGGGLRRGGRCVEEGGSHPPNARGSYCKCTGPVHLVRHWAASKPDLWDITFLCEKKKIVKARGPSEQWGPGQLPRLPRPKFGPVYRYRRTIETNLSADISSFLQLSPTISRFRRGSSENLHFRYLCWHHFYSATNCKL